MNMSVRGMHSIPLHGRSVILSAQNV